MNTPARSRRRARSPARRNLEGARSMHFRRLEAITRARNVPLMLAALTAARALLAAPAAHAAFLPLPATGAQVNDDPVNSIDPSEDAGVADVAGGSLTAGKVQVPWATFEQRVAGGGQHIFVRAFKNGAWVTQGFPASLNIDPTEEAEAPSIDFAGAGRTVPWVAWYEPHATLGWPTNIFASRFNAAANLWLPSGQARGGHLPSLNIHVLRTAENPSVAGGAAVAGKDPVPWVTWEENDGVPDDGTTRRQIFVSKGVTQAVAGTACPVRTKRVRANDVNGLRCRAARPCRGSSGRRTWGTASTPSSSRDWSAAIISSSSTPASRSRTRRTTRRDPTSRSPATCPTSPGRRTCPRRR